MLKREIVTNRAENRAPHKRLGGRLTLVAVLIWSAGEGLWSPSALAQGRSGPDTGVRKELSAVIPSGDDTLQIAPSIDSRSVDPIAPNRVIPEWSDVRAIEDEQPDGLDAYERDAREAETFQKLSSRTEYWTTDGSFESDQTRALGIRVEDYWSVSLDGGWLGGVAITGVASGSPAESAGLRGQRAAVQYLLDGAVVAVAVFFPPAFAGVPLLRQERIGESYDLIVGVDGERIRDVLGLEDQLEKSKPGEIVYLSIIRGRQRLQIPVALPDSPALQQPLPPKQSP